MGVDYYLLCESQKEYFFLGGMYSWPEFEFQDNSGQEEFFSDLETLVGPDSVEQLTFIRKLASELWDWCVKRNWGVYVISDCGDEYSKIDIDKWKETGDIHNISTLSHDEIRLKVEKAVNSLKYELGADSVYVRATIGDSFVFIPYGDEDEEEHYWEYSAEDSYKSKSSGYRRFACKKKVDFVEDEL